MSFKTLFDKAQKVNSLSNKSAKEIGGEVESVGYHKEDIINEKRYIPGVDFSDPATFARYGSAEEYYIQSIEVIMKVVSSLKTLKVRDRNCQVVRRRGRLYVINKKNPRFKARQG